ncbi:MAG: diguanylate cyclase [Chloroflexi bacterium]|uniref:Diguanylate cyclase n=1 Tax=Candidatus Chlorohelix allophototropha TaxID=3003348 RepID=A0A8T7LVP2_9CHLR|nr:diguanylate cyclase [Chloroflexota bacterium]WJW65473.1 diguanylate cyclase [Chloroflexota bacterium L227-S17]
MQGKEKGTDNRYHTFLLATQQLAGLFPRFEEKGNIVKVAIKIIAKALDVESAIIFNISADEKTLVPLFPELISSNNLDLASFGGNVSTDDSNSTMVRAFISRQVVSSRQNIPPILSEMAVPLIFQEELKGVLVVINSKTGDFDEVDKEGAVTLTTQLSALLKLVDNGLNVKENKGANLEFPVENNLILNQIRRLESLQGIIDAISELSNIEEIYRRTLLETVNYIKFDIGAIHTLDPISGVLKLVSYFEPDDVEGVRVVDSNEYRQNFNSDRTSLSGIPFELCNSFQAYEQDKAEYINEAVCPVVQNAGNFKSSICQVIKAQDIIYGVLHLGCLDSAVFSETDYMLANGICKQVGVAVERASIFEDIKQLARTDSLTGLYNKLEFWERIDKEMRRAERHRRPLSLVMIDLDRLKWFNDVFGHTKGDILLSKMGQLIRHNCRAGDTPFRYGGDEMCILLADTGSEEAGIMAERLRISAREIKLPLEADEVIIGANAMVTMSIGISSFPTDAQSAELLFEYADAAMYRAKDTGKDRVCLFDPNVDLSKQTYRYRAARLAAETDKRLEIPKSSNNPQNTANGSKTPDKTRDINVVGMEEIDLDK